MHKINVFQNELDLYEEFWYRHSKLANVTPNISTSYFLLFRSTIIYHLKRLSKIYKLKEAGWTLPWKTDSTKPPTCIDEYKYDVALYLEHLEDKKRCYSYLKKVLFFSFFFCKI